MTRLLATIVLLCTQVLAVFGTGNLVFCVHDDGECAIEMVGSECCRAAHDAERRQPDRSDAAQPAVTAPPADRCTDIPYRQDQTIVAHGSPLRSQSIHETRSVPLAIVAWTSPVHVVAARVAHRSVRGPPRDAVPRASRAFVLRC